MFFATHSASSLLTFLARSCPDECRAAGHKLNDSLFRPLRLEWRRLSKGVRGWAQARKEAFVSPLLFFDVTCECGPPQQSHPPCCQYTCPA